MKSDIQCDIDTQRACFLHQAAEILQRTQLRVNRFVAPVRSTDRPWAARISFARLQRVIRALAFGQTDGMNRRQVHYIESHFRHVGQPFFAFGKSPVTHAFAHT